MKLSIKQIILDITPPDMDGQCNLIIKKEESSKYGIKIKLNCFTNGGTEGEGKGIEDKKIDYITKFLNRTDINGVIQYPKFSLRTMELFIPEYENFSNILKECKEGIEQRKEDTQESQIAQIAKALNLK